MRSSGVPSRCNTTTGGPSRSSASLIVGQHGAAVALRDQQRASLPGGIDREPVPVDDAHAARRRVDAEPRPHEIDERQRGHDGQLDHAGRRRLTEQLDRPLADRRRAGHGVQHFAVLAGGGDESSSDLGIDVIDRLGRVVDVVERDRSVDQGGRRVPRRAHEPHRHTGDRVAGRGGDEVRSCGAEADDDDSAGDHGPGVGGTSEPVTGVPSRSTGPWCSQPPAA